MQPVVHRDAPTSAGQFPQFVAKVLKGAIRPTQLLPPEGKTEKEAVVGLHDMALVLINHQFELAGQKARDAGHDPFTRAVAFHQDQQVVRITDEPMPPTFQFLVQVVQQDVGKQRRQRSALWRSQRRCLKGFSNQNPRPQVFADQPQPPLVAHLPTHAGHQDVVLDVVEEFRQVQIDADAVACADIGLYPPKCSMGAAFWSEAETRIRKPRIADRPQDLCDGLLNHPVHHGRYPEQPFTPARLGDRDPSHRLRLIAAIPQGLVNRWPVRTGKLGEVLDGHPVDSRRPSVGLHPPPCPLQVLTVQDPHHQVVVQGWLPGTAPHTLSPGRVQQRWRVAQGSSLAGHVRPFTAAVSHRGRLIWPLLTSVRSRQGLLRGALRDPVAALPDSLVPLGSLAVRLDLVNQWSDWSLSDPVTRRHVEQTSPNKSMNFPCTTAALTLSPVPEGLHHLVLTRPGTEPSMRFLFVGSHVCHRASSRHPLAGLPLPSASRYRLPKHGNTRYFYRGLASHQFMPMSGVHKALVRTQTTLRFVCATQRQRYA